MDKLYSLNEIFEKRFFRIPDYQRGYAWRADKEIKEFWEDIVNLNDSRSHYTGQITLEKVPDKISKLWNDELFLINNMYKPMYIVDGQQRLTTSVILIQCICDFLNSINPGLSDDDINFDFTTLKEIKEHYLVKVYQKITKTYLFGYESDNPSFTFLKNRIFHEQTASQENETYYTLNLENAQKFFNHNIQLLYNQEKLDGITKVFRVLTKQMKFNLFEIDKNQCEFDVFAAFESMNNRGKKLSNLELLKNRLIYLTTLYTEHELNSISKESLRKEINDAWKVVYAQLGRNKNRPLDDDEFLYAHWIMHFPYSRKGASDYVRFLLDDYFSIKKIQRISADVDGIEYVQMLKDEDVWDDEIDDVIQPVVSSLTPQDIRDYVISLKEASVKWYETWFPTDSSVNLESDERLWLDRLNRIGITYFRPLVTALLLRDDIQCLKRVELFKTIERFIFLAFRCMSAQSNYKNSEFYGSARRILKGEQTIDNVISRLEEHIKYTFTHTESGEFFNSDYLYNALNRKFESGEGFYSWGGLRYFLFEYEYDLCQQGGQRRTAPNWSDSEGMEKGHISIEHILPQTPNNDYWKEKFQNIADEKMKYYQGTLGNLLLLNKSINSSLQNDSFPDKNKVKTDDQGKVIRQGYSNGSYSENEVAQNKDWTPETIKVRGLKLLLFMESRWNLKFKSEEDKLRLLFLNDLNLNN
jgi:uncharacterized protein with ParB-like and HNH nuclease domain